MARWTFWLAAADISSKSCNPKQKVNKCDIPIKFWVPAYVNSIQELEIF